MRIKLDFCVIVRKNMCDAIFYPYNISNSIANGIIVLRAKQC